MTDPSRATADQTAGHATRVHGARIAGPLALAVALTSLAVYAATLAPGLTWAHDSADGGELAAAARTLGIPHSPGYPTYVLLAHLFTRLPLGEVATRTNLFSALCAAATAALVTWALARSRCRPVAAAGAGLGLAFAPLLWSQATVTEVHALNALFTGLLLALAVATGEGGSWRGRPVLVGAVWGLSLGNHATAVFLAPLVLLAARRRALQAAAGCALGLAVYLYLPLRAAAGPPLNWGDPRTLRQFWWTVSGGPYGQFVFALPLAHLPARILAWAGLLVQQFTALGLGVAFVGAAVLWTARRPLFWASAASAALCSVFAIGYNTTDSYLYLMPALVCLALWLGVGADGLISVLAARARWAAQFATALVLALPLLAALSRFAALDLSEDRTARAFQAATLERAPQDAVIVSQQDAHTFALWYYQLALGERPDVTVVDPGLLDYEWYAAPLADRLGERPATGLFDTGDEGLRQAARQLGLPVCRIDAQETELTCVE